jgi:tetratricopeptide (TPR) repeat protein
MHHYLQGNYSTAIDDLQYAFNTELASEKKARAGLFLGRTLTASGQTVRGLVVYVSAKKLDGPASVTAGIKFGEAECLTRLGRAAEAQPKWVALIEGNSTKDFIPMDSALYLLADCYRQLGRPDDAQSLYHEISTNELLSIVSTPHVLAAREGKGLDLAAIRSATPPATLRGKIFIQVAASKDAENARFTADKLKSRGYPVSLTKTPSGMTLVHVGPYPTRSAADKALLSLRAEAYGSAYVIQ